MLHEFVTENRGEIIARTRAKVALRSSPLVREDELVNGVSLFLDQLVEALSTRSPRMQPLAQAPLGTEPTCWPMNR